MLQRGTHFCKIRAEYLEYYFSPYAADGFFYVVFHRLRKIVSHTRYFYQFGAHFIDQALLVVARTPVFFGFKPDERLAHIDVLVVRSILGPALLAHGFADFGESQDALAYFK